MTMTTYDAQKLGGPSYHAAHVAQHCCHKELQCNHRGCSPACWGRNPMTQGPNSFRVLSSFLSYFPGTSVELKSATLASSRRPAASPQRLPVTKTLRRKASPSGSGVVSDRTRARSAAGNDSMTSSSFKSLGSPLPATMYNALNSQPALAAATFLSQLPVIFRPSSHGTSIVRGVALEPPPSKKSEQVSTCLFFLQCLVGLAKCEAHSGQQISQTSSLAMIRCSRWPVLSLRRPLQLPQ